MPQNLESLDAARVAQLFQALIRNAFDVIKVVDADARTIFVSPSVERVLGYQPRELLGANPLDYVHADDLNHATMMMQAILRDGGILRVGPIRALHKDGSWRTLDVVVQDLREDEAVRGVVMNYRDVTDRLEAEDQLRLLEERYEKAFRNSPDSITITYLDTGRIVEVNDGFERISGYSREEIAGKTTLEVGLWKNPEQRKQVTDTIEREGRCRDVPVEIQVKGGEIRHCLVSAELIELGGRRCLLATTRDVTEARVAEEMLRRTTEALRLEHGELVRKNIALKEVLGHLEAEKEHYRHELCANVDNLVRPILRRLGQDGNLTRTDIGQLQRGLDEVTGRHIDQYKNNVSKLTPRELDILEMIRAGRSSKQIADVLGLSSQTVHKHRQSIRRKLQIDHREINLASYLRSR